MISALRIVMLAALLGVSSHPFASRIPAKGNHFSLPAPKPLIKKLKKKYPDLSPYALLAGILAYDHLKEKDQSLKPLLTLVNFNKPSNQKRLWVINLKSDRVDYHTYVAQGKNTGLKIAKYFSNSPNTYKSSIGVYITGKPYYGVEGYSLRLHGLDQGFNNNVFKRNIVMHPAWYVSQSFIQHHGYAGRTHGCFGINRNIATSLINTIKDGTVMVAYYPNEKWLKNSLYEQPFYSSHI